MNKLLDQLNHYKNFIIGLVVIGLFGYTAFQLSQITNVAPSDSEVQAAISSRNAAKIKLNNKVIDQLSGTLVIPVDASPGDVGKADPFN
jgi:hypothetical protein